MKMLHQKKGFGMVELIVCIGIIAVISIAALTTWNSFIKVTVDSSSLTKAALLTEEAGEVFTLWRDMGWNNYIKNYTLGTTYYLTWNGSTYATSTTATAFQNNYVTSFQLSSVRRDGSSDIVASGGTIDVDTLKATIRVSLLSATSTPLSTSELLIHNVYAN